MIAPAAQRFVLKRVDERDGRRPFPDRGGHALGRAVPDVAGDEDAGDST
jgi:hypothetical protein